MNPDDIHQITRGEIEHILKCLRFIDQAREALETKGQATHHEDSRGQSWPKEAP